MSPTNVKLADIFKTVQVPPELSDAYIYSSDANSGERTMTITVVSENIIPYEVIENFKKEVCKKYSLSGFILRVKYQNVTLDSIDIKLYYSNLIFYVNELIPGVRHIFQDSTADFAEGVFTVHCKYGTHMLDATNCEEMLKRLVKAQLGASVEFVFSSSAGFSSSVFSGGS